MKACLEQIREKPPAFRIDGADWHTYSPSRWVCADVMLNNVAAGFSLSGGPLTGSPRCSLATERYVRLD